MAAASFLATRATLFGGGRAPPGAREIRPAPRSGGTIRDVPFTGAPRPPDRRPTVHELAWVPRARVNARVWR